MKLLSVFLLLLPLGCDSSYATKPMANQSPISENKFSETKKLLANAQENLSQPDHVTAQAYTFSNEMNQIQSIRFSGIESALKAPPELKANN
jgi:hypothetical protein